MNHFSSGTRICIYKHACNRNNKKLKLSKGLSSKNDFTLNCYIEAFICVFITFMVEHAGSFS